jgi:N4-gp56 family major capsid protein
MAGEFSPTNSVVHTPVGTGEVSTVSRTRSSSAFVPELWSDEILATYKANLVLANLVKKINHNGKKGDTIHVPTFASRGAPSIKGNESQVTLIANQAEETPFLIDKHYEYSFLIEDFAEKLAQPGYRQWVTDDAGYALAKQVDQDLMILLAGVGSGDTTANTIWDAAVSGDDGSTLFSAASYTSAGTLTDAAIRKMSQTLDDNDVPMQDRFLVIPPVEVNNLRGIPRFTEQAFVGDGSTISTGRLGNLYGIEIFVSTNCPWVSIDAAGYSTAADQWTGFVDTDFSSGATGTDVLGNAFNFTSGAATDYRIGTLMHKDALLHIEAMGVRSQTGYMQQYLSTLFTADTIYGTGEWRDENAVAFAVPA